MVRVDVGKLFQKKSGKQEINDKIFSGRILSSVCTYCCVGACLDRQYHAVLEGSSRVGG